jgi:hypothetical protein
MGVRAVNVLANHITVFDHPSHVRNDPPSWCFVFLRLDRHVP